MGITLFFGASILALAGQAAHEMSIKKTGTEQKLLTASAVIAFSSSIVAFTSLLLVGVILL